MDCTEFHIPETPDALLEITAGCVGGVAQVLSSHPLDTAKVRLQTQIHVRGREPVYKGVGHTLSKIWTQEGMAGLYRGVASPMWGVSLFNCVMFYSYETSKSWLVGKEKRELNLREIFVAGFITGVAVSLVDAPFDNLKCKVQAQVPGQVKTYKGIVDAGIKIFSQFGFFGLNQGMAITILRNAPANGNFFWTYEGVRRYFTPQNQQPTLLTTFFAGGCAGVTSWTCIYPIELIKSRLQSDASSPSARKYKGIVHCFTETLRHEGAGAFFKGFNMCILRAIPANCFCFMGYEWCREFILSVRSSRCL